MRVRANELRIGNWVEYNKTSIGTVSSIIQPKPLKDKHYSDKWVLELNIRGILTATIDECEPIPLTEEWLERFGFDKTDWRFTYDISLNAYRLERKYNGFDSSEWVWISNVRFVHEWQNLYFALTGEELTIKK